MDVRTRTARFLDALLMAYGVAFVAAIAAGAAFLLRYGVPYTG
jgi:hypothetical protein